MTYRFRYRARNVNGWSDWSPESSIKAAARPAAPSPVLYVSSDATKITVTIQPSQDNMGSLITAYKLFMDDGDFASDLQVVADYDGVSATFQVTDTDHGITAGLLYRFHSTAVNDIGESDESSEVIIAAASLPAKPTSITRGNLSTQTQIQVEWDIEPDTEVLITGYSLEADLNQCGDFHEVWNGRGRPEIQNFTIAAGIETGQYYTFRHRSFNFNGASEYSDPFTTYACDMPSKQAKPFWISSTTTSITIQWLEPTTDGGCPVLEYKVFRDSGAGLGLVDVTTEVHASETADEPYLTSLTVTEFPVASEGNHFVFVVKVVTAHAVDGVASFPSDPLVLAGLPDQPLNAPTRNALTNELSIVADYEAVVGTNGSPIRSYHVEIDDGFGGAFTELKGYSLTNLLLTAAKSTGINTGRYYRVRYRAKNEVGFGLWSDPGYILAATRPYQPYEIHVVILNTDVKISWQMPYNGGSFIYESEVLIASVDGSTFEASPNCDGTDNVIFYQRYCILDISELQAVPFELVQGSPMIPQIRFHNDIGWSEWSVIISPPYKMQAVPHAPENAPRRVEELTFGVSMGVEFDELTGDQTGGSEILSYELQIDSSGSGVGPFDTVQGFNSDSLDLSAFVTPLVPGTKYYYRYRARNAVGWGDFSPLLESLMASQPDQIDPAFTENVGATVTIAWNEPLDNSSALTAYRVKVKTKGQVMEDVTNDCAENTATLLATKVCTIEMSLLTASPFDLEREEDVVATVEALNEIGYSTPSVESSMQAVVQSVPDKPLTGPSRGSNTDETQIEVILATVTEDGGASIVSYSLEIDTGSGFASISGDPTDSLDQTVVDNSASIVSGDTISLRYRVSNVYGWSEYSDVTTILVAQVPSEPLLPVSSNNAGQSFVTLSWTAPTNTGASSVLIAAYEVRIEQYNGVYSAVTECDGTTDAAIVSGLTCNVEMATLWASPFFLLQGEPVVIKVRAENEIGWGDFSLTNSAPLDQALVETKPHKPASTPTRNADTTDLLLHGDIVALSDPEDGGSPILSYHIEYDDASKGAIWTELSGFTSDSLVLEASTTTSIQAGQTYLWRYRAKNIHGWGPYSNNLKMIAARVPDQPNPVVTSNEGTYVRITWNFDSPLYNGGSKLIGYHVRILDALGDPYEVVNHCNGMDQTVKANQFCLVPMSLLIGTDFDLLEGNLVVATVEAVNVIGAGVPSVSNGSGAVVRTAPLAPPDPIVRVDPGTDDTQITVSYKNLAYPFNGGSAILSMNLWWDQGVGNWAPLNGEFPFYSMATSYSVRPVKAGKVYKFKYRAINLFGYGDFSPELSVTASYVPSKMAAAVTKVVGKYVRISWAKPNDTGASITAYRVSIHKNDGTLLEDAECDGSVNPALTILYCDVLLTTLINPSKFNLAQGDLVVAQVQATNSYGQQPLLSPVNIVGALVQIVPHAPANAPLRGSKTKQTQLEVKIDALSGLEFGGTAITTYVIEWNAGSGTTFYPLVGDTSPNFVMTHLFVTGVISGSRYNFRYYARNAQGNGLYSPVSEIIAGTVPAKMAKPVVALVSGLNYRVSWAEPNTGGTGLLISAYEVLFKKSDGTFLAAADCTASLVLATRVCEANLATLNDTTTFNLIKNKEVIATVRASNDIGFGLYSDESVNGAKIVTIPTNPLAAPTRNSASTKTNVAVTMGSLTGDQTGGLPILSYSLERNGGGTDEVTWVHLVGGDADVTATAFTASSLTTGTMYKFRYRVKNEVGWSAASPILTTYAGIIPSTLAAPTTEIDTDFKKVLIKWTPPSDNGGLTVTAYKILVRALDGSYKESQATCDASDSTIRDANQCLIPMATLIAAPFSIPQQTIVQAKAIAINNVGSSLISSANISGALLERVPFKPPVSPKKNLATSTTTLVVDYTHLVGSAQGGTTVLSYEVSWDQGPIGVFAVLDTSMASQVTINSGIASGTTYGFRYRAQNRQGYGDYSDVALISATNTPMQMTPVVTSMNGASVRFDWTAPNNNGSPVTAYKLEVEFNNGTFAELKTYCNASLSEVV